MALSLSSLAYNTGAARHDRKAGRRVKVLAVRDIGIIINGATGRIASTQHLANALLPIRAEGGLAVGDDRVVPRLLLAGRDEKRLAALARSNGIDRWRQCSACPH
jgi:hypothetical protein